MSDLSKDEYMNDTKRDAVGPSTALRTVVPAAVVKTVRDGWRREHFGCRGSQIERAK